MEGVMVADHGIPLILCTIDEAARAHQWDRVRLLTEGLCARLTDDKAAMLDWLRQLQRVYRKYAVPECCLLYTSVPEHLSLRWVTHWAPLPSPPKEPKP